MLSGSQSVYTRRFGPAWSMASIACRMAGDASSNFKRHPVELLYYQGAWELTERLCVAVVGTRKPTGDGIERADRLARELVERGFAVASGLAAGIDTAAHRAAMKKGSTIAVIGTPLGSHYPRENRDLQDQIAREFLVISQVPVLRYRRQHVPQQNRFFFPERNVTMSALTEATVIVEASETSGTLTQARAALYQGRKLFILNSCFERSDLTWPARFEAQGSEHCLGS